MFVKAVHCLENVGSKRSDINERSLAEKVSLLAQFVGGQKIYISTEKLSTSIKSTSQRYGIFPLCYKKIAGHMASVKYTIETTNHALNSRYNEISQTQHTLQSLFHYVLDGIHALGPLLKLTDIECVLVKHARDNLYKVHKNDGKFGIVKNKSEYNERVLKHLLITNWNDKKEIEKAVKYLFRSEATFLEAVKADFSCILLLLQSSVQANEVRSFGIELLRKLSVNVTGCQSLRQILPQLVQGLKGENRCFSALYDFLMEVALQDPLNAGLIIFWVINTENDTDDSLRGYGEVYLRQYLAYLGDGIVRAVFEEQLQLWSKTGLFAQLNTYIRNPDSTRAPSYSNANGANSNVVKGSYARKNQATYTNGSFNGVDLIRVLFKVRILPIHFFLLSLMMGVCYTPTG